jgi:CRISPR/Cas system-associated exonuclease Cas4 (RecB family)
LKKKLDSIKLKDVHNSSKVSATSLANFEFCPASYAIQQSFIIDKSTNEDKRLIGIDLHESLRLVKKTTGEKDEKKSYYGYDVLHNKLINKIKNCELIFSGHTQEKKFFINDERNYIGQPDYIFKDPKGKHFVVEEKFKYLNQYSDQGHSDYEKTKNEKNKIKTTFFSNHIVQIKSYIDYIKEYEIEYGVLIYWFYDLIDQLPHVHSVSLKVINRNDNNNLLESTFSDLQSFIDKGGIDFKSNLNVNKCTSCSVNKYCAHKTGNFKHLEFPYDKSKLKLTQIEFPEKLKKRESDEK